MGANRRAARGLQAIFLTVAFALAGCYQTAPDGAPAVDFRDHAQLGPILADAEGLTLYIFTNDDEGVSNCNGQCAQNWPPYLRDEVPPAPDSIASRLSLVERTDGMHQVAYDGRPLYYFASDAVPGEAKGDGLNAVWFVVRPSPANPEEMNGRGTHQVDAMAVQYGPEANGYVAMPQGAAATTGVVMIHEWWGLNDNIKQMAEILASHGYMVLAVDLFNDSVATTSQEAQAQVGALDQDAATHNMRAAALYLREEGATRIASLGWCFGGSQSLQLSLSGETLVATVIYYGTGLVTDANRLDVIEWPVLGIFGEDDQAIPVSSVRAFEEALENVSVENDIYIYPDVGHAFANPSGDGWAPDQTKDAWMRTIDFLEAHTS